MLPVLDKTLIKKFDVPGPRYTSYPTAPQWSEEIQSSNYQQRLSDLGKSQKTTSLYIHLPFCETMCSFCACHVVIRRPGEKYATQYIDYLVKEMDLVCEYLGKRIPVKQLHWGGGTPTFLSEDQMTRLREEMQSHFEIDWSGEIAVEVDPRRLTKNKLERLRSLGFNRISLGIQDFNPIVQVAVNRIQPFEIVQQVTSWIRELKFSSLNFDLIYGLPLQTQEGFKQTIDQTIQLHPDRIALYSFAYLPWLKKHQTKIMVDQLPSPDQKIDLFLLARERFVKAGYQAIAMDHFALSEDELARASQQGVLYRNFMGYTVKPADEYIGLGVSAIGFIEDMYIQNQKILNSYYQHLDHRQLPVERGKRLSFDDRIRCWVINALMCQFRLDKDYFSQLFQLKFDEYFKEEQIHIEHCLSDQLIEIQNQVIQVTELGKLFIRNICMGFDWYLHQIGSHQRFSRTI